MGHPAWVQSPAQKPTLTLHQGKPKVPRVWCSEILSPTPTPPHLSVLKDLPPLPPPTLENRSGKAGVGGAGGQLLPHPREALEQLSWLASPAVSYTNHF